jgi:N-acetylgalactosamine-N,N'-diacetylbacillosaminyl-diphospho-undecaprenol 4-alpha-N-acetylgalactosaminyltransferase
MNKKVLFFSISLSQGGAERIISNILNEIDTNSFKPYLVLLSKKKFYDIPENIPIFYLSKYSENTIIYFLSFPILIYRLVKLINTQKIDIIISFLNKPSIIAYFSNLFIGKRNEIKFLIAERSNPLYKSDKILSLFFIKFYLLNKIYNSADFVLVNSKGFYQDIQKVFNLPESKLYLFNNFIKSQKAINSATKNEIRNFLTIGRLDKGKNIKLLLDAFISLNNSNLKLTVVGKGPLSIKFRKYLLKNDKYNQVVILDSYKNIPSLFFENDIFLFSSEHEGFPNVVLESITCGVPVVSTNCKYGPSEILQHSYINDNNYSITKYGILVNNFDLDNFRNAILYSINNIDLYNQWRFNIRNYNSIYSTNIVLRSFFDFLKKI